MTNRKAAFALSILKCLYDNTILSKVVGDGIFKRKQRVFSDFDGKSGKMLSYEFNIHVLFDANQGLLLKAFEYSMHVAFQALLYY